MMLDYLHKKIDKNHEVAKIQRRTRALSDGMEGITSSQPCLVPCNASGNHWIFTLIFPHDEEVCLMDPFYNGIHDLGWKQVVEISHNRVTHMMKSMKCERSGQNVVKHTCIRRKMY